MLSYYFQAEAAHNMINEATVGFIAGYTAAFFTNGLETIAVNK
jgi:hypothetical protein